MRRGTERLRPAVAGVKTEEAVNAARERLSRRGGIYHGEISGGKELAVIALHADLIKLRALQIEHIVARGGRPAVISGVAALAARDECLAAARRGDIFAAALLGRDVERQSLAAADKIERKVCLIVSFDEVGVVAGV